MMAQFLGIKEGYPDAILFYRMGDFYEMFFDDAISAAQALDIALTKRGKHLGNDIPMCGVPVHSAEGYLLTLIRKGFRVAVCEQMETPAEAKKRGAKSVVKRAVVRLVTPGTLTEDTLLEARRNNFLAAFSQVRNKAALAWVDISTGELRVSPCPIVRLAPELARLAPSEVVVADGVSDEITALVSDSGASLTPIAPASFDSTAAKKRLVELFKVTSLDGFGQFGRAEVAALGAIVDYLDITQKGKLPMLRPPVQERSETVMQIDAATRRNLELTRNLSGGRDATLLSVIDQTVTAGGGRLLERRLSSPSRDLAAIQARLDGIDFMIENRRLCEDIREDLRKAPDMDRALSRLGLERGGPRDVGAIRAGLQQAQTISAQLSGHTPPEILAEAAVEMTGHGAIIRLLEAAFVPDPPLLARDGGFIAVGYDTDLDEARKLRDEGRSVIAGLQADYAKHTGISTLKIKHNNVLGYFIEVTSTHAKTMLSEPLSESYIHRQTTANAVRFTTVNLAELETRILNARNRALEIEKRLYSTVIVEILAVGAKINSAASALSEIDLAAGLATLTVAGNWCRPVVDSGRAFQVENGRHPVVEAALEAQSGTPFIANTCDLANGSDRADIWLLTGPNMAGKSTFLRQNALIALLAQIGSFVPATSAHIGLVSQLFSRVGASDDLARGRSTFMVEMVETAAILNQADSRALVILDEIGRGTATYDGLSIAWATLEHLHDVNQCRALFATHYHEMTSLSDKLDGVDNATVTVKEWEGEVIFLHEVRRGAADRSYGVQVARLAGLPSAVVDRARVVLEALEKGERKGSNAKQALVDDLPLFSALPSPVIQKQQPSEVDKRIADILPDDLTPKAALNLIYELKKLSTSGSS
ncbi:MAG: DNA mismatch repair protein MutS [Paracoccaceae bacterium]